MTQYGALAIWLGLWSLVSFAQFGLDKRRARLRRGRVPERRLLQVALIGGAPGAKLAQRTFRHKTRKQPFARRLNAALALNLALVLAGVVLGFGS